MPIGFEYYDKFEPCLSDKPLSRLDYQLAYEVLTRVRASTYIQDALLIYYNSQAAIADANVEKRLELN